MPSQKFPSRKEAPAEIVAPFQLIHMYRFSYCVLNFWELRPCREALLSSALFLIPAQGSRGGWGVRAAEGAAILLRGGMLNACCLPTLKRPSGSPKFGRR